MNNILWSIYGFLMFIIYIVQSRVTYSWREDIYSIWKVAKLVVTIHLDYFNFLTIWHMNYAEFRSKFKLNALITFLYTYIIPLATATHNITCTLTEIICIPMWGTENGEYEFKNHAYVWYRSLIYTHNLFCIISSMCCF